MFIALLYVCLNTHGIPVEFTVRLVGVGSLLVPRDQTQVLWLGWEEFTLV